MDYSSYPSESCLTEWEKSGLCGALKVDEGTNCFIAFDSSGKVVGQLRASAIHTVTSSNHSMQAKRGMGSTCQAHDSLMRGIKQVSPR